MSRHLIYLLFPLLAFMACKKENRVIRVDKPQLGPNPYDTVNYNPGGQVPSNIDKASFLGLHSYIFSAKCAMPACHDGSFEPDFRTVESAYSSLVYKTVLKNDPAASFQYRVLPFNADKSWLHERVVTTNSVIGRMPLYAPALNAEEVGNIRTWINNGAKDLLGNVPSLGDSTPAFFGIVAYLPDSGNMRVDQRRQNIIAPFEVVKGSKVDIWFGFYDTRTYPFFFTYNKIKFSTRIEDFSAATTENLIVTTTPHMAPPFGGGGNLPYFVHYVLDTSPYSQGDVVYFRTYVQDAHHTTPAEIPASGSQLYLLTYFSMLIK